MKILEEREGTSRGEHHLATSIINCPKHSHLNDSPCSSAMALSDEVPPPTISETLENDSAAVVAESAEVGAANESSAFETAKEGGGVSSSGGDTGCSSRSQVEGEEGLALADELFEKGSKAIEDEDFVTAVDCLSRALEIRVSHCGELAPECAFAYYKYGCALLYKAQEEADPLGNVPKERTNSAASVVGHRDKSGSSGDSISSHKQDDGEKTTDGDPEIEDGDSGDEEDDDVTDVDEDDESDLDLAWKMLDIARVIAEKCPGDTMEKVKIFSALAEASMEREDFDTSLADFQRALSMLENLVEPSHRRVIELNFRICLLLEVGSKIEEAIPYCEKAISLCKIRLQHLKEESLKTQSSTSALPDSGSCFSSSETGSELAEPQLSDSSLREKEEEIQAISGFQTELEKKLEDLQQAILNPKSILSEYLKMVSAKPASEGKDANIVEPKSLSASSSQVGTIKNCFDSPAVSTAATNGCITHLGVVGRGVKRASAVPLAAEPPKKLANDPSEKATSSASDSPDFANTDSVTK